MIIKIEKCDSEEMAIEKAIRMTMESGIKVRIRIRKEETIHIPLDF